MENTSLMDFPVAFFPLNSPNQHKISREVKKTVGGRLWKGNKQQLRGTRSFCEAVER